MLSNTYFDCDLQHGRADDFIDELLQLYLVGNIGTSTQNLVDPVGAAEEIIQIRKIVAQDWKAMTSHVSEEHTSIRQALLTIDQYIFQRCNYIINI